VQESKDNSDKAVVFPAYMNYNYSKNFSESAPGFFNEPGVRLADAAIFAAGGAHVELGDGDKMLLHEYFPNINLRMSASLKAAMQNYYNFLVAYENLLRDGTQASSMQVNVSNVAAGTSGEAGKVWVLPKRRAGYDIVHLINLENNTSNEWRDTNANYPAPDVFTNLPIKMYYRGSLNAGARLFYATPDDQFGKPQQLSYNTGSDAGGKYVSFTLPRLHYWDMIWLEVNDTATGGPPIGKTIWLKANANGRYVSAWNDTHRTLQARVDAVGTWEQFQVVDAGNGHIALKATINNKYVSAWNDTYRTLQARVDWIGEWEKFQWIDAGGGSIALKANANGQYVSAWNDANRTLQARVTWIGEWEKFQWAE
jgi:dextranase